MEKTLLIIKPDGVEKKVIGEVIRRVENEGFRIMEISMVQLSREKAEDLYSIHRDKEFFPSVIEFILSGPIVVLKLEHSEAITKLRELAGTTNPADAGKGTIRGDFGSTIQNNIVHASDSPESATRELDIFFPNSESING
jgi:nucleoside-diphosphate kinase